MRWLATIGLAVLILAFSLLGRVSDYAHAGQPVRAWNVSVGGMPLGELALIFGMSAFLAVMAGRLTVLRRINFLTVFNSIAATLMLAGVAVALFKG